MTIQQLRFISLSIDGETGQSHWIIIFIYPVTGALKYQSFQVFSKCIINSVVDTGFSQTGGVVLLYRLKNELAYVHTHVTCDMWRATCNIFAANTFSYAVHTLATCDMRPRSVTCDRDKFAHVAILLHVTWGGGGGMGGKLEMMGEKLRKKSIFLYNVCC